MGVLFPDGSFAIISLHVYRILETSALTTTTETRRFSSWLVNLMPARSTLLFESDSYHQQLESPAVFMEARVSCKIPVLQQNCHCWISHNCKWVGYDAMESNASPLFGGTYCFYLQGWWVSPVCSTVKMGYTASHSGRQYSSQLFHNPKYENISAYFYLHCALGKVCGYWLLSTYRYARDSSSCSTTVLTGSFAACL
jgi:hypothetical protein